MQYTNKYICIRRNKIYFLRSSCTCVQRSWTIRPWTMDQLSIDGGRLVQPVDGSSTITGRPVQTLKYMKIFIYKHDTFIHTDKSGASMDDWSTVLQTYRPPQVDDSSNNWTYRPPLTNAGTTGTEEVLNYKYTLLLPFVSYMIYLKYYAGRFYLLQQ